MAVSSGALSPVRSYTEVWETTVVFDIGAAGAHTVKYGRGISSVTRQAAGQFTVNFTDVGGALLDLEVRYQSVAAGVPVIGKLVVDSFVASPNGGGSALFEVFSVTTTPVRVDPASGSDGVITARFLKSL